MVLWMLVYASSTCFSILLSILVYFKLKGIGTPSTNKHHHGGKHSDSLDHPTSHGPNAQAKHEAFITISCLCVASICCRLPLPLVGMLLITIIERRFGQAVRSWTLASVVLLLYLVFVVDPVVYFLRMHEVRNTMCKGLNSVLKCINGWGCKHVDAQGYQVVHHTKQESKKENIQMSVTCATNIKTSPV